MAARPLPRLQSERRGDPLAGRPGAGGSTSSVWSRARDRWDRKPARGAKSLSSSLAAFGNLRAVLIILLNKPQFFSIRQCARPDQRIPSLAARPVAHLELERPVCQIGWRSAADEEATMARGSKVFRPDDVSE